MVRTLDPHRQNQLQWSSTGKHSLEKYFVTLYCLLKSSLFPCILSLLTVKYSVKAKCRKKSVTTLSRKYFITGFLIGFIYISIAIMDFFDSLETKLSWKMKINCTNGWHRFTADRWCQTHPSQQTTGSPTDTQFHPTDHYVSVSGLLDYSRQLINNLSTFAFSVSNQNNLLDLS